MAETNMHVKNVRYDARSRRYQGVVTFLEPNGMQILEVSAAGMPDWGYERAVRALCDAGLRMRADQPRPPSERARANDQRLRPARA